MGCAVGGYEAGERVEGGGEAGGFVVEENVEKGEVGIMMIGMVCIEKK